jgi:hypothetical protein
MLGRRFDGAGYFWGLGLTWFSTEFWRTQRFAPAPSVSSRTLWAEISTSRAGFTILARERLVFPPRSY